MAEFDFLYIDFFCSLTLFILTFNVHYLQLLHRPIAISVENM